MTDPIENLTADQRQLYELMSEISEDCYCAGWMVGNEYTLWSSIQTGEMRYGMSDIDRDLLAQVAALSVKTGCWITWRDYKDGLPRSDSSTWGPYAIPLVEWNAIYEAKNDMRPERATQPAQRQSQIDIHLITCQEARKIGGGLIDTIPADDVTALGRAIYQRILDSQPAQDQVAAVRAVPERPNWNMLDALYGKGWIEKSPAEQIGMIQAYRNMLDAATLKLPPVAAPYPQPELSGSIDSDEFRQRLRGLRNCTLQETMDIELNEICEAIDAWKDAACALAREEGRQQACAEIVRMGSKFKKAKIADEPDLIAENSELRQRATDAEAKLAAIREGVVTAPIFDQAEFDTMVEKGTKAWAGVPAPRQEPQPVAEQSELPDMFQARQTFLEWNRALAAERKPIVSVGAEYGVFNKAIEFARAAIAAIQQPQDAIHKLIALHGTELEGNDYAYFELARTRRTGWMAWICTNMRDDDPGRKVLATGQGETPDEACAVAAADYEARAALAQRTSTPSQGDTSGLPG